MLVQRLLSLWDWAARNRCHHWLALYLTPPDEGVVFVFPHVSYDNISITLCRYYSVMHFALQYTRAIAQKLEGNRSEYSPCRTTHWSSRSSVGYRRDEGNFSFIIKHPASSRHNCYWFGFDFSNMFLGLMFLRCRSCEASI